MNGLAKAKFVMLRYETEFTPCTGITAVTKQERRNFVDGVMISPWCGGLERKEAKNDPVKSGRVRDTGWTFLIGTLQCKVLAATDGFCPTLFLDVQGRFLGKETPYEIGRAHV